MIAGSAAIVSLRVAAAVVHEDDRARMGAGERPLYDRLHAGLW